MSKTRERKILWKLLFAWVLWSETASSDPLGAGWRVIDASETEAGCRIALQDNISRARDVFSAGLSDFRLSDRGYSVTVFDEAWKVVHFSMVTLYCLPDSVDPRKK